MVTEKVAAVPALFVRLEGGVSKAGRFGDAVTSRSLEYAPNPELF